MTFRENVMVENINEKTYSTAEKGSFADRATYNTRLKIYKVLSKFWKYEAGQDYRRCY